MVPEMYVGLMPALRPAAARSVYAAIEYLVAIGKVQTDGEPELDSEYRLS
jgi:hypothetical protein